MCEYPAAKNNHAERNKLDKSDAVTLMFDLDGSYFTGTEAAAAVRCRRGDGEEFARDVQEDFRRRSRGRRLRTARHSQLSIHERYEQ